MPLNSVRIGVLALQGAFIEHEKVLSALGVECFEIRQRRDFSQTMNGLILPGGESTVMGKLLNELDLFQPIRTAISEGLPVLGTCAGTILLAKTITGAESWFGCMDITVERNAYGRQLDSFYTEAEFKNAGVVPMVFIRAPHIASVGEGVDIAAKVNDRIVAVKQKNMLACTFHPELTDSAAVHLQFLQMCG